MGKYKLMSTFPSVLDEEKEQISSKKSTRSLHFLCLLTHGQADSQLIQLIFQKYSFRDYQLINTYGLWQC